MPNNESGVIAYLHNVAIFADLSITAVQDLANNCDMKSYEKGEMILYAEENSTDMYCILSGAVRVLNYSLSGREIVYDDICAGGIFGEICALDGLGRSAHVIAIEPVQVARFQRSVFIETLESYPQVAIALSRHLAAIIRAAGRRIIDTSTKSSRLRLLMEILTMSDAQGGRNAQQMVLGKFPTHRDLAGKIGCTRETVTRILQSLGEEGLILRDGTNFYLPDIAALRKALEIEQPD